MPGGIASLDDDIITLSRVTVENTHVTSNRTRLSKYIQIIQISEGDEH